MREAFPWDRAPRYVLRDRDAIYGKDFDAMTRDMGMEEVLTAPRSPWQNPFAERLVGSSDASAWTTLWCGTRDRCVGPCKGILPPKQSVYLPALLGAFSLRSSWISLSNALLSTIPSCKSAILPSRSISNVTGSAVMPNLLAKSQSPITTG